jgi:hypothetical protein
MQQRAGDAAACMRCPPVAADDLLLALPDGLQVRLLLLIKVQVLVHGARGQLREGQQHRVRGMA